MCNLCPSCVLHQEAHVCQHMGSITQDAAWTWSCFNCSILSEHDVAIKQARSHDRVLSGCRTFNIGPHSHNRHLSAGGACVLAEV